MPGANIFGELHRAQLERLAADPTAGVSSRVIWNTAEGRAKLDNGSAYRAILLNDANCTIGNSGTANTNIRLHRGATSVLQFVRGGDTTNEGTLSTDLAQISARQENYTTAALPSAANVGRMVYDTTTGWPKFDTGAAWVSLVGDTLTQTLTNKTLTSPTINSPTINNPQINGIDVATRTETDTYTAVSTDDVIFMNAATAKTINLPTAVGIAGKIYWLKNINTGLVTIDPNGSQTIDGATTYVLVQNEVVVVQSDNANWQIIGYTPISSSYTPTLTGVTNVQASTAKVCQYAKIKSYVQVSGTYDLDPTSAGVSTELGISLPIASNFTLTTDCSGTGNNDGDSGRNFVNADATNDRAQATVIPGAGGNATQYFQFGYLLK